MRLATGPSFDSVSLYDDLDFVMRPVLRGLCRYESVVDGTLGIEDIAIMNDALDVQDENTWRAQEAARGQAS